MECEVLWEKILGITKEIVNVEESYKGKLSKNSCEERKDILHLKRQLTDLENHKQEVKKKFECEVKNYMDQQSQILTRKWIKNQKKRLLKCRTKERAEIKLDKDRCERLITDCKTLLEKFTRLKIDAKPIICYSGKEKKKKKSKFIDALKLEALRTQFEYFYVSPPENEEDLELAIPQLEEKLKDILATSLTEVIGTEEESEESNTSSTFEQ